jgi:hypothetical protein
VPIYDARNADSNFVDVLSNLKKLPRYSRDIPAGSCAVMGYTVNTFNKPGDDLPHISLNAHWVMLLSLP